MVVVVVVGSFNCWPRDCICSDVRDPTNDRLSLTPVPPPGTIGGVATAAVGAGRLAGINLEAWLVLFPPRDPGTRGLSTFPRGTGKGFSALRVPDRGLSRPPGKEPSVFPPREPGKGLSLLPPPPRDPGKGLSLDMDPHRDLFLAFSLSELSLRNLSMCSAVGVLSPEVGGLGAGVIEAEPIPLMSMVGEVREERGVNMVDGMMVVRGGDLDFDFPLTVEISSVAERQKHKDFNFDWLSFFLS